MNTSTQKGKGNQDSMWQFTKEIFIEGSRDTGTAKLIKECLAGAVVVILLSVMVCLIIAWLQQGYEEMQGEYVEPKTLSEHREAHEYHGILFAYIDNGTWVFERDGQKCKLFKEGEVK